MLGMLDGYKNRDTRSIIVVVVPCTLWKFGRRFRELGVFIISSNTQNHAILPYSFHTSPFPNFQDGPLAGEHRVL
jgi:hypothetical protein